MKRVKIDIKLYVASLCLSCLTVSCLSSEEGKDPTSECAITAFSINDIKTVFHYLDHDGNDSTVTRVMSGSDIDFHIDQINGRISTVDSLPTWVDLTHVVPSVTSYGTLFGKAEGDSLYRYIESGSDSLDFSAPYELLVAGYDNLSVKRYLVTFNKSKVDADSLIWTFKDSLDIQGDFQALGRDGRIYTFTTSDDIQCNSVLLFGNKFYALDSNGVVKCSADGTEWTPTALTAQTLMSTDRNYLYGFDGTHIVSSSSMTQWEVCDADSLHRLPVYNISSVAYLTKTNETLQNVVMIGNHDEDDSHTQVWYKLSSKNTINDQKWNYIHITPDNNYALPVFKHISNVFHYLGSLFVLGDGVFYQSVDKGITWRPIKSKMIVPQGFDVSQPVRIVVIGNNIHMIQSGNQVHKGMSWVGRFNGIAG